MSRDISPEEPGGIRHADPDARAIEQAIRDPDQEIAPRPSGASRPIHERPDETGRSAIHFVRGRAVLYDRARFYRLTASQIRTIRDLGKFRVIAAYDLGEHAYDGRHAEAEKDVDSLVRQGLVRRGTFEGPEATPRELITLTRQGHCLLPANVLVPRDQAVYHGFVKRKEANHDADLYRLYQKEAARIESEGGAKLRVILDYELKRKINRDIARFGTAARPEIAGRYGLKIVGNKIPVPDLRIEYETRDGEMARVNLELVTEHYRGASIAEKVRAGFSLYTPRGESDHLRRVLDQHELTADILSL